MDLRGPKLFFIGFILLALYGTAFSSFCTREYEGKKPCRKTFDSLKFIGIVFTYSSTCPENRTEKACCTGYTGENCSELTNACKEEEKCAGHMCTEQYTEGCMCKKEEKINEAFMGKDTRTILVQCEYPCERKGCCNGYKGDECNEVIKSAFLSEKEMDNIREQLKIDEGYKDVIYIDSEGYPTFGIGHLIRKTDEEHRKPVGTKVSEERIRAVFKADVHIATTEVKVLFPKACSFPGEVKEILVNMIFNLGRPRLKKFKKFVAAVNARNWTTAAAEMIDSKWYRQVGDRAKRLVERMKAVPQSDDQGDLNGTCEVIKSAFLSEKEMDNIREQLKIDEGYKDVIYIDSEGYPTFGIGHLIRKTDEEHGKPVGTKVSEERIRAVFKADVHNATTEVKVLFPKACSFPGEVKEILVNMIFNLGRPRLKKFKMFVAAVNARNWTTAAAEMIDSKWYRQVGDRAKRLVKRMKAVPQSDDQGDLNGTCEVIKSAFLSEKEMDNIREQLKIDEGYKDVIYIDSEGYPTFGIGHLIRKTDEEHGKPVGTKVSEERIRAVFKADVHIATTEVKVLFPKACSFPGEVKEILVNMIFNLGRPRLKKFKKFVAAVNARNWTTAAAEMIDSKWYRQVGDRAKRLVERMKAVEDCSSIG